MEGRHSCPPDLSHTEPMPNHFTTHTAPAPDLETTKARYAKLTTALETATTAEAALTVLQQWDTLLTEIKEWASLTQIHFHQDTTNPDYKAAMDYLDAEGSKFTTLEVDFKNRLLASPFRAELEAATAPQLFALWQCNANAYGSAIEADTAAEAALASEYTALVSSGALVFDGETLNLSQIGKHYESPDRDIRHRTCLAASQWFSDNASELDRIYDDQVKLHQTMAEKLGYPNYVPLAYEARTRIGFGPDDIATFRNEVAEHVVPLATELAKTQAANLGVDSLKYWDEPVQFPDGNPTPQGDHDTLVASATTMFESMGHGLDTLFTTMVDRGLIDLEARKAKAGGGFCDFLHQLDLPFIFANFNGTRGDVDVFTHEMGHAFQAHSSRNAPHSDIVWPTTEACEIHSMALEYLAWPHLDLFYGEEPAEKIRHAHLASSVAFLPYGVCIDHFQHTVHENPDASPADRLTMWQELEKTYLPWYDYGDLPAESAGRLWQMKQHLYNAPFYYIDYTLALTGALQFWQKSQTDYPSTLDTYTALCQRGGTLPFTGLLDSAGLESPFTPGTLKSVITEARNYLA
ncbi:MAG: M3 family oligoendopeptidase, partial [Verrucomicrobiales bacterium]|nr:M3 family oligoendopeptidase [Verrucomicrobiales bacterium]